MALEDDIDTLAGVGLFEGLSHEQLRLLAFGTERLRLPAGRELYRENAAADCAFLVVSGSIALTRERDGARHVLATVGPGAVLGELALIAPTRRITGAVAETDSNLMRLNRSLFRRILEEYPEVAMALHRKIQDGLTDMLARIGDLAPRFS